MLLYPSEYKKYIKNHYDIINDIFKRNYRFDMYVSFWEKWEVLLTKTGSDGNLYTYDEIEDSLSFIDNYVRKHVNFFLFTDQRHKYLLDTIKRLGDIEKSERLLQETIRKWYLN